MSNENREWLSALVDGELSGDELRRALDALRDDPQLQASWQAYHLIRDGVSSNLNDGVAPQLHQRISTALESEPTVLAPRGGRRSWAKQITGLAIAASVAGIAILGVQRMNNMEGGSGVPQLAENAEYIRMEPTQLAEREREAANSETLDRYLVNHNEYSANSGIQGVLPYVRIVGHKSVK
ncbi:MAG: sigma-E factor negative regulatory protein [Chromatiales bacterium]|nr:sigma-E factor negative regulatory protein [Chromatiales bacterium]